MATQHACTTLVTAEALPCCVGVPDWVVDEAIEAASDMLYLLAPQYAFGRCTAVVRPCATACHVCGMYLCDHCYPPGVDLPGIRPVVDSVLVDGDIVPSDSYTMLDCRLVRFLPDGRYDHWPTHQLLTLPSTEPETFEVTYTHGVEADLVVRNAAAEIACDLIAPWRGDRSLLPRGVTSANMNGVSVSIDPDEVNTATFPWLARLMNTYRITSNPPAAIWSPEIAGDWRLFTRV